MFKSKERGLTSGFMSRCVCPGRDFPAPVRRGDSQLSAVWHHRLARAHGLLCAELSATSASIESSLKTSLVITKVLQRSQIPAATPVTSKWQSRYFGEDQSCTIFLFQQLRFSSSQWYLPGVSQEMAFAVLKGSHLKSRFQSVCF